MAALAGPGGGAAMWSPPGVAAVGGTRAQRVRWTGTRLQLMNRYGPSMAAVKAGYSMGSDRAALQLQNRLEDGYTGAGRYSRAKLRNYGQRIRRNPSTYRRYGGRGDYNILSGMVLTQPSTWRPITYTR